MDCFFLFDLTENNLHFHAEYCTSSAVHTMSGAVTDIEALYAATKTKNGDELLAYLTTRFSANNLFFTFLQENGIAFTLTDKSYADTSSDV